MSKFLASTALALVMGLGVAAPAFADAHAKMMQTYKTEMKGDFYAADFIGKEIYTSELEWDENYIARDGWEKDWNNIGQVENVILGQDGTVRAVILEVGGFLDIGDKHVAVPMDQLTFIRNENSWDNYFLAVRTTKDALMAEPEFKKLSSDERAELYRPTSAEVAATVDNTVTTVENTTAAAANTVVEGASTVLVAPAVNVEGYTPITMEDMEKLTAEDLDDAEVYGISGDDIGEVESVILSSDGAKVESLVLEIGGFLGLGDHNVLVPMSQISLVRADDGDDIRVYVDATKEQLEALPEYED